MVFSPVYLAGLKSGTNTNSVGHKDDLSDSYLPTSGSFYAHLKSPSLTRNDKILAQWQTIGCEEKVWRSLLKSEHTVNILTSVWLRRIDERISWSWAAESHEQSMFNDDQRHFSCYCVGMMFQKFADRH